VSNRKLLTSWRSLHAGLTSHASLRGLCDEQLEEIASDWSFLIRYRIHLTWGVSELHRLDRKRILQCWEESEHETSFITRKTSQSSLAGE